MAQLRLTYLVCEGKEGLYIVDQHAAAERVAFTKLLAQYRSKSTASQSLLFPVAVALTTEEVELVEAHAIAFRQLGLDVRSRGRDRVSVHSTPRLLQRASPEGLLRDVLLEFTRAGAAAAVNAGVGMTASASVIERAIAMMACHGSLRAGEALTAQQAQGLLVSLDDVDLATDCAHGRPVLATLRFADLERQLRRA